MSAVHPAPPSSTPPSDSRIVAGWRDLSGDWSSDRTAFKQVPWGKAMMWIFLLSDTFIFGSFLTGYMTVRMSTLDAWPNPSTVFALHIGGQDIPLILIAIMTFVLITSSGTMAMAVNFGYRRDRVKAAGLMVVTAFFGADVRRHAGVRVEQAHLRRRAAVGQPVGRGAVRLGLLHDHRLPRPARVHRRDLPADRGLARVLAASTRRRATRSSRSRACTGTSWTWCGCSSSRSSTCGEVMP